MTVITYGTFDLMHYGHLLLLKRCKALGDKLIVGVSTDKMCITKGKRTVFNTQQRMEMVSDLKFVDLVIPEHDMKQKIEDIKKYKADIFVLGSDYKDVFPKMTEYPEVAKLCKVVFLERTPNISTSILKQEMEQNNGQ